MIDRDTQIRRTARLLVRHKGLKWADAIERLIHLAPSARASLHGALIKKGKKVSAQKWRLRRKQVKNAA